MKTAFTYDDVYYISDTNAQPTTINFDNPTDAQTEEVTSGYSLMGTGFKSINEAPNAETEETGYINQKSMSTTTKSYNNKWSGSADKIVDDKAVMNLYDIAYYQKTGEEAERNLVEIDRSQPYGADGKTYKARLIRVSCVISNIAKEATNKITYDFELSAVKDPVFGKFDTSTKTFTVHDTTKPAAGAGSI